MTLGSDDAGGPIADPVAHYHRAAELGAAGLWPEHRDALRTAQALHGEAILAHSTADRARMAADAAYAEEVGNFFYSRRMMGAACVAYRYGAGSAAAPLSLLLSYGLAFQHQGRLDEAIGIFRLALERFPNEAHARGFLLYALFFVEDGVRAHAEAAKSFASIYAGAERKSSDSFANRPIRGRKLRIGYVAPDISGSQLRQFLLPVLENHDLNAVEPFHYVQTAPKTPPPCGTVRVIGTMSDAQAARTIREDRIDVLIDLWGHTANGRLGVFARRAAPVQASWMNYVQTTGIAEIDYLLHPDCLNVPGAQETCVEQLWHIGPEMGPFRPDPRPAPMPTPASRNGYVTFGCYSHPVRLSDLTLDLWARILAAAPTAKLALRYRYYEDEVLRNAVVTRFAARGIGAGRLAFRGHAEQPEYYQSYAEIDFALDPAPCPAGTTSLDALANGVPVLTLAGTDYYSRIGVANTGPMGLHELITESADDYVGRAIALTADAAALDALRKRVRTAFDASGRRDEAGFTRRFEGELVKLFERWSARRSAQSAA
jgi:predicted O-linked N-acetylglucosamine transferase (SPINDLY family)